MNLFNSGEVRASHGVGALDGVPRIKSSRPGGTVDGFGFILGPVVPGTSLGLTSIICGPPGNFLISIGLEGSTFGPGGFR